MALEQLSEGACSAGVQAEREVDEGDDDDEEEHHILSLVTTSG